jgi:D-alanyl-D-alanine carboxypeptidase
MRLHLALGCICFSLLGCGGSPTSGASFASAIPIATAAVQTDLTNVGANGAIVFVSSPRGQWERGFGFADAERKVPMNPSMQFRIASITKTFTAAAVLQLVQNGLIKHPTDLISTYIPTPPSANLPYWSQITIEELANHTSGIAGGPPAPESPDGDSAFDLTSVVSNAVTHNKPGAVYDYENMNFSILALLIYQVSGLSYPDYLAQNVFPAVGLTQTLQASSGTQPALQCLGYSGNENVTTWNPSWAAGAGDIVSTASDLANWMRQLMTGQVITTMHDTLVTVVPPSDMTGFGIQESNGWFGHTGRIDGYSSACYYNPEFDTSVVVMVNRMDVDDPSNYVARELVFLRDVSNAFFPGSGVAGSAVD